ncbi:unnamed protein product, partial [Prorocentrum cordatum]
PLVAQAGGACAWERAAQSRERFLHPGADSPGPRQPIPPLSPGGTLGCQGHCWRRPRHEPRPRADAGPRPRGGRRGGRRCGAPRQGGLLRPRRGPEPGGGGAARRGRSGVARASGEPPELKSDREVDYSKLKDLLSSSDFRGADQETRDLLIQLGGPAAVKRGWVYFIEVRTMPVADLQTIDSLWQHYSKGKFGFASQRKIWRQCREQFDKFALEVSWFTDKWKNRNWPDDFIYSVDAPSGHLPLTNCIRGAQVLQELLAHPAFEKKKIISSTPSDSGPRKSGLSLL